jgi:hypothetical protein
MWWGLEGDLLSCRVLVLAFQAPLFFFFFFFLSFFILFFLFCFFFFVSAQALGVAWHRMASGRREV